MSGTRVIPLTLAENNAIEHRAFMSRLPHATREAIGYLAAGVADAAAVLSPKLGLTTRMVERAFAAYALENESNATEVWACSHTLAQRVITARAAVVGMAVPTQPPF